MACHNDVKGEVEVGCGHNIEAWIIFLKCTCFKVGGDVNFGMIRGLGTFIKNEAHPTF
jgi:hypothetical protein